MRGKRILSVLLCFIMLAIPISSSGLILTEVQAKTEVAKKQKVATPNKLDLSNSSANSLKLSWNKVSNSSGYEVYRATNKKGSYTKIKTITSGKKIAYTDKNLSNNKFYYYKVRAYKTVSGNKLYSNYSAIIAKKVVLPKATITKVERKENGIKLTWKKAAGAQKYEIYRASSSGGKYKKIKTITGLTYTDTSVKSGQTNYYKVRAVQKIGTKTYSSLYSNVKSAKWIKAKASTGNYIANFGTKKFHLPSCRSLPKEQNRVYFSTRQGAIDAGYNACKVCKP